MPSSVYRPTAFLVIWATSGWPAVAAQTVPQVGRASDRAGEDTRPLQNDLCSVVPMLAFGMPNKRFAPSSQQSSLRASLSPP